MSIPLLVGLALQVGGATPAIVERARLDPRADVSFHALALPETAYVGQPVIYELGVFIADEVRSRIRKNPEFVPPDLRSVLAYELRETRAARVVVREGRTYEVHVFRRALFPLTSGRIDIPPAKLSYSLPLGSSFFSREETKLLSSEPVTIFAVAPPTTGRPANWNGAVGDLRVSTSVAAASARVGDPFVVTVRVSGEANVNLLPRPVLVVPWGSVVPGAERVSIDSAATNVRGAKEFDWLVTPNEEGSATVPPVQYPYFDPWQREYRIARSSAQSVHVVAGGLVAVDSVATTPGVAAKLPLRMAWSRPWPDAPDRSLWYWILCALVPLPAVGALWKQRPRARAADTPDSSLRALARDHVGDGGRVLDTLRRALSARLGGTVIPWADPPALRRSLRHHGVTDETIADAMTLLARVESSAYGKQHEGVTDAASKACAVYDAIDQEARGAKRPRVSRRAGAVAIVLLALTAGAQDALTPRASFERGVTSYREGAASAAAADFLRAARAVPNEAPAWANAGTAAWVAGDTALAVVGWQRALRLNPLDDEARQQLLLVGADAGAGRDSVWPIPRRIPAWIALALWLGGWTVLWRGRRKRVALGVVAAAVTIVAVSQVHGRRLSTANVAVVALPVPLRALPALGSDAGATPLTGELVHVEARDGLWVRIAASGGREGWIDGARLIDLDARSMRD